MSSNGVPVNQKWWYSGDTIRNNGDQMTVLVIAPSWVIAAISKAAGTEIVEARKIRVLDDSNNRNSNSHRNGLVIVVLRIVTVFNCDEHSY